MPQFFSFLFKIFIASKTELHRICQHVHIKKFFPSICHQTQTRVITFINSSLWHTGTIYYFLQLMYWFYKGKNYVKNEKLLYILGSNQYLQKTVSNGLNGKSSSKKLIIPRKLEIEGTLSAIFVIETLHYDCSFVSRM